MVDYDGREPKEKGLSPQRIKRRSFSEAYYEKEPEPKKHYKQPDNGAKMDKKPDAMKHEGKNVFKSKEKYCLPGQLYVKKEKEVHNESDFAGEQKQKSMY